MTEPYEKRRFAMNKVLQYILIIVALFLFAGSIHVPLSQLSQYSVVFGPEIYDGLILLL